MFLKKFKLNQNDLDQKKNFENKIRINFNISADLLSYSKFD